MVPERGIVADLLRQRFSLHQSVNLHTTYAYRNQQALQNLPLGSNRHVGYHHADSHVGSIGSVQASRCVMESRSRNMH